MAGKRRKAQQEIVSPTEVERRRRWWFEHYAEFSGPVVVWAPVTRTAQVGLFSGGQDHVGLFGSMPFDYHDIEVDRGEFSIHDDALWVLTPTMTYCWLIESTNVDIGNGGIEVRVPNEPVRAIHGPIAEVVAGAYGSYGRLNV